MLARLNRSLEPYVPLSKVLYFLARPTTYFPRQYCGEAGLHPLLEGPVRQLCLIFFPNTQEFSMISFKFQVTIHIAAGCTIDEA